jgi:FAD:protein FMN transferase
MSNPFHFLRRYFFLLCVGLFLLTVYVLSFLYGSLPGFCKKEMLITGQTMATTYHVKVITGPFKRSGRLKAQINRRLQQINSCMSTFQSESEISRFNSRLSTESFMTVSEDFFNVLKKASFIYEWTGGAWDGTVLPLVDLWGFGKNGALKKPPHQAEIAKILHHIGFSNIKISPDRTVLKTDSLTMLDLASIAKGFAVDQVAALLEKNGFHQFLVEIGGEIYASGVRKDGRPWQIGINVPDRRAGHQDVYRVVALQNRAMATSGDYRNYFEDNGRFYSHIIDPRTGYPVSNGIVSATVLSKKCSIADGLATALMVMDIKSGIDLINRLDGIECFIIKKFESKKLQNYFSKNFITRPTGSKQ